VAVDSGPFISGIKAANLFEHVANPLLANLEISFFDRGRPDYLFDEFACQFNIEHEADQYCSSRDRQECLSPPSHPLAGWKM
jgi:hypothetical protein